MSIQYRTVDPEATEKNVLRQRVVEAESAAYQQEAEVKRLEALEAVVSTKEEKAALKQAVKGAKEAAKTPRARANRLNQDGVASEEDLAGARKAFLEQWIPSLEGEHVSHTALIKQREQSLATTGENAPSDEDRERIQANIDSSKEALVVIESAWKVATAELDSLS